MFYSQPLATRFGTNLIAHIGSGIWNRLDIAVAWVRASGMAHLNPALTAFLKGGNELNVVVGVDLDNTSREGLETLLSLEAHGTASIFVYHNEAATIFHPKLYLFRNQKRAKLIVGSNNLTEAGLFQNTEAGLELEGTIGDPIIVSAIHALDSWRDTSLGTAKKLDAAFLAELVGNGYIQDEATVRAATAARRAASLKAKGGAGKKLFGSVPVTPPPKPAPSSKSPPQSPVAAGPKGPSKSGGVSTTIPTVAPSATGQVLLMRVRKARGTQVQIPLVVMQTPFFHGITQVLSVSNMVTRGIHPTHATRAGVGANPNTLKLEMPETGSMTDPIARFERTSSGIQYEVYDRSTPKGHAIMQALQVGLSAKPPSTFLTVPSSPTSSTWWRFI